MHTDAFMTTAAQVLPTLAVALAVEASVIYRSVLNRVPRKDFEAARSKIASLVAGTASSIAVGEVAALSALLVHYRGWTVWIPLGLTIYALFHALAGTVIVPTYQILSFTRPTRPRRKRLPLR